MDKNWAQETFNKAWHGLESQGWQQSTRLAISSGGGGGCAYRGADGRRCAVGYLIPDELYAPEFEGLCADYGNRNAGSRRDRWFKVLDGITNGDRSEEVQIFLTRMQEAHDCSPEPEVMKRRFTEIAVQYGLEVPHE